jgi:hypothetical protein
LTFDLAKEIAASGKQFELRQIKLLFTSQILSLLEKGLAGLFSDNKVSQTFVDGINELCGAIDSESVQKGSTSRTKKLMEDAIAFFDKLPKPNNSSQVKNDGQSSIKYRNITDKFTVTITNPSKECLYFVSITDDHRIINEFFALMLDIYHIKKEKELFAQQDIRTNIATLEKLENILKDGNFDKAMLKNIAALTAVSLATTTASTYVSFTQLATEKSSDEGKMRSRIETVLDRAHKFAESIKMTTLNNNDSNSSSSSSSPVSSPTGSPSSSRSN